MVILERWWTSDGVPILSPEGPGYQRAALVPAGCWCIVHGGWSALAWNGETLGAACCLKRDGEP
jgi:hypothetical protein